MALSQSNINSSTPMGATLVPGGATFKVWGPRARAVYLNGVFGGVANWSTNTNSAYLLSLDASGYWTGFLSGVVEGDVYKYYVVGQPGGSVGYKRDPYARELSASTTFPFSVNCIVRSPSSYPWHDQSFVTPDYSNLIIYQLHVGVFAPARFPNCGTFLDVIAKIPYLVALGINLLQPLPIAECKGTHHEGYDGADLFSPDCLYTVYDPTALVSYLANVNSLLAAKGCAPLTQQQITAEYWPSEFTAPVPCIVQPAGQGGAGFDTVQHDALRLAIRGAIHAASYGQSSAVNMDAILGSLYPPGLPQAWNGVPCVENHDVVYVGKDVRIPVLADGLDAQSFHARSRSKFATGLLLAAPGIPQIFMGQEFLENRQWCDDPTAQSNLLEWVALNSGNKSMSDQLRFTQDFIRLRWNQRALRGQSINPYYANNNDRVIAFHRWIDGEGLDVVVVASLNDNPFFSYQLGFPQSGRWSELFNSDIYDNWVNPLAIGNHGAIYANGGSMHNLPYSASITIPPRSILVFGVG